MSSGSLSPDHYYGTSWNSVANSPAYDGIVTESNTMQLNKY